MQRKLMWQDGCELKTAVKGEFVCGFAITREREGLSIDTYGDGGADIAEIALGMAALCIEMKISPDMINRAMKAHAAQVPTLTDDIDKLWAELQRRATHE